MAEERTNEESLIAGKVVISDERYKLLKDDFYLVEVTEWSIKEGKYGTNIVMSYKVLTAGAYHNRTFNDFIHSKKDTGRNGRFWQLVKATCGLELGVADVADLSSLIGKRCYIHVERRGKNNAATEYFSERTFADIRRGGQ